MEYKRQYIFFKRYKSFHVLHLWYQYNRIESIASRKRKISIQSQTNEKLLLKYSFTLSLSNIWKLHSHFLKTKHAFYIKNSITTRQIETLYISISSRDSSASMKTIYGNLTVILLLARWSETIKAQTLTPESII